MKNWRFILALVGAVLLAILFPQLGAKDGPIQAGLLSKLGVMIIFFLQGLILPTRELAGGLRQPRLHICTQACIFLFAALVLVLSGFLLKAFSLPGLANGFFYLALVPTTISSAVIFSSAAGGNIPAAIFNVTLANIIGVFWVPTGCLLIFSTGGHFPAELIGPLLWEIAKLILLPLLVGQALRPLVHQQQGFLKAVPWFKVINNAIILFIVFASFSQSILSDAWQGVSPLSLVLLVVVTLAAMIVIHAGVWFMSKWACFNWEDRVTVLFCGSQKTLAAGAPIAIAVFTSSEHLAGINLGLILLPLLCYHSGQLILASLLLPVLSDAS